MSPGLAVVAAGLATSVQDVGRPGWQRYGVPVSGALDAIALAAANTVAGNPPGTAGLECLYMGPTMEVRAASARVVVAGAGASIEVLTPPQCLIPALESVCLDHGVRFRVVIGGPSISAYLAISGGLDVPRVLGSRSTYARAGLGGLGGRALRAGDLLPIASLRAAPGPEVMLAGVDLAPASLVHVVAGPQADRFTARAHATLGEATYTVMTASDRMGLRLEGERLEHTRGADIISDAIAPGTIQVPGDGRPIIMLADRQTTGGYTKIATVASADLPGLGRVGPGARLRFRFIDVVEAESRRRALDWAVAGWPSRLRHVAAARAADVVYEANLVSGVFDAMADPFGGGLCL